MKLNSKIICLLALSGPLMAAETSLEQGISSPFTWSVSDHALATSEKDPGDPEAPAINILNHQTTLGSGWGNLSAQLAFSNRISQNSDPLLNRPIILDKKTLAGDWENWEVRLGDSHQEFGRGIALALFNNPAFGVDNTLEGASVHFRSETLSVLGLAGRVNALQAPVAINPVDSLMTDREVRIAGGAITANPISNIQVTGRFHTTESQPDGKAVNKKYQTYGLGLESRDVLPGLDAYAETNWMDWEAATSSKGFKKKPRGYASFAALTYSDLAFKTKLEAKDYRQFVYDFQRPPTLEEEIVLATNNSDVSAARWSVEGRFGEDRASSVGASYLRGEDRELKTSIHHPLVFSKVKWSPGFEMEARGGYRWMPEKNNLAHGSLKGKIKTAKGQYVEIELRKQLLNQAILSPIPIREERNAVLTTYTFSESFNVGFGYEYMPTNIPELGNHFVNGSATYKTGMLTARGFVGQTSGGTQCASGVCRQVPPYTGAYLETQLAF